MMHGKCTSGIWKAARNREIAFEAVALQQLNLAAR